MLNILYLSAWYPHRHDPMPGLFVHRHAVAASQHAQVGVLFVKDEPGRRKGFDITEATEDGLRTVRVYYAGARGQRLWHKLGKHIRFLRAYRKGWRYWRQKSPRPDLVHVNILTRTGAVAWWLFKTRGIPYVITEHWTRYLPYVDNFHGALRQWLTRKVVKNARAVLPVTHDLGKAMQAWGLKNPNYQVIPNVVDTQLFRPQSQEEGPVVRFAHVSCFEDKHKNVTGILRVLHRLSQVRQDFICHFVGEGPDYQEIVAYADQLGIKGKYARFVGLKENQALVDEVAQAKFTVLFSNWENLPVVILESMACGVPIISTDVGGIREHLKPEYGKLIPSGDEDALFDALQAMLDGYTHHSREALVKYAREHFSEGAIGLSLYKVYQKATGKS